jgi:hypothetical protein
VGDVEGFEPLFILSAVTAWRYSAPRGAENAHELTADSISQYNLVRTTGEKRGRTYHAVDAGE